jgi:hypothetical protein
VRYKWVTEKLRIPGEELLIDTTEFQNFARTRERLDILALNPEGKLVVVELKRDKANENTDLQAIKYASYCAILTAQDVQEEDRKFHRKHAESPMAPEDGGGHFISLLDELDKLFTTDEESWAEFGLDDRLRILLAVLDGIYFFRGGCGAESRDFGYNKVSKTRYGYLDPSGPSLTTGSGCA